MIRPTTVADSPALVALSASSGLFKTDELGAIQAMLEEYHANLASSGHQMLAYDDGGALIAVVYFAPKEFTDRVWELLMIAVDASHQRRGVGSQMLKAVEAAVQRAHGRLLLIETSDLASFERTRRFYAKHGYTEVAHIPDYFCDGEGKASFIKRVPVDGDLSLVSERQLPL